MTSEHVSKKLVELMRSCLHPQPIDVKQAVNGDAAFYILKWCPYCGAAYQMGDGKMSWTPPAFIA